MTHDYWASHSNQNLGRLAFLNALRGLFWLPILVIAIAALSFQRHQRVREIMEMLTSPDPIVTPILARGRGLGKLIEGLWNGDPVAWGITGVVVAIMIGVAVFKRATGAGDE